MFLWLRYRISFKKETLLFRISFIKETNLLCKGDHTYRIYNIGSWYGTRGFCTSKEQTHIPLSVFLIRVKYTAQRFLIRIKSIAIPLWQLIVQRVLFVSLTRLIKVKKRCLLYIPLLVKRRRFCSFCLFKPGFCKFLAKNLFKMRYYAIFRLFITVFTIKRHIVPRCGAFMKEKKAFSFPI